MKGTLKRDVTTVTRGLKSSIHVLVSWINEKADKEIVKRRIIITASVPAGFMVIGSEFPGASISGAFLSLGLAIFWCARTEEQHMVIHFTDFDGPFRVGSTVMDFEELVSHVARAVPDATVDELIRIVVRDFSGPVLTTSEMTSYLELRGIRFKAVYKPVVPLTEVVSTPEPTGADSGEKNASPMGKLRELARKINPSPAERGGADKAENAGQNGHHAQGEGQIQGPEVGFEKEATFETSDPDINIKNQGSAKADVRTPGGEVDVRNQVGVASDHEHEEDRTRSAGEARPVGSADEHLPGGGPGGHRDDVHVDAG